MKATVDWTGNASFRVTSGTGHSVQLDGPPDHGGENLGPRPMEMLLMGLGGCSSFDVMSILKKVVRTSPLVMPKWKLNVPMPCHRCSQRFTCILLSLAAT